MDARVASLFGIGFAVLAAICNGTVGVLSRYAFSDDFTHTDVAFWRCLGAFGIITLIVTLMPGGLAQVRAHLADAWKIAIAAFLGVFMLYHFETEAIAHAPIPLVAVLVFAGGIGALALDVVVLKERISTVKAVAIAIVFSGGAMLIARDGLALGSTSGIVYALLAGLGYASFIFAWKYFRLRSGLASLWWFFLFGTVYLSVPFVSNGPSVPTGETIAPMVALAIVPSFGGFLCTTLALKYIEAFKTQVIEASEPVFSAGFAFAVFGEMLTGTGLIAAAMILTGTLLTILPSRTRAPNRASSEPYAHPVASTGAPGSLSARPTASRLPPRE